MTFHEFHQQVYSVLDAIYEAETKNPPTAPIPVPKDWSKLQTILRGVAESLILCADVPSTISTLRAEKGALQAVVFIALEVEPRILLFAEKSAHETMPESTTVFPGFAFSAFLIELCNNLSAE